MPSAMILGPLTTAAAPPAIPAACAGSDQATGPAAEFAGVLRAVGGTAAQGADGTTTGVAAQGVTGPMRAAILPGIHAATIPGLTAAAAQPGQNAAAAQTGQNAAGVQPGQNAAVQPGLDAAALALGAAGKGQAATGSGAAVADTGRSSPQNVAADAVSRPVPFNAARWLATEKSAGGRAPIAGGAARPGLDASVADASQAQSAGGAAETPGQGTPAAATDAGPTTGRRDTMGPEAAPIDPTLALVSGAASAAAAPQSRTDGRHGGSANHAKAAPQPAAGAVDAAPATGPPAADALAATVPIAAPAAVNQPAAPVAADASSKPVHAPAAAIGGGTAVLPGQDRRSDDGVDGAASPEIAASGGAAERQPTPSNPPIPAAPGAATLPAIAPLPVAQPDQTAASTPATGGSDASTIAAAGPVHQVSAALLSLSRGTDGSQSMTLRLQPPELGQVQIRIDRPQDAPAQVDITVQRPETMTLLLRDQPELQRALDQAGVPPDGRSLTFHVATPDAPAPAAGAHGGMAANAGSGQGGGGNGSGSRTGGAGNGEEFADAAENDDTSILLPRWLRAGLDITA